MLGQGLQVRVATRASHAACPNINRTGRCGRKAAIFCALFAAGTSLNLKGQSKPCIAYRTNGELRANCDGKDALLLKRPGLASFAIGVDDGTVLGGQNWAYLWRSGVWAQLDVRPNTWVDKLYESCGIALAPRGDTALAKQRIVDVVTGKPASFSDLRWPQCSVDRSLIVGINKAGELITNSGKILAPSGQSYSFAVSPSGQWIALLRDDDRSVKLCLSDSRNVHTRCYSKDASGHNELRSLSPLSVNNAGEVLLEIGTGEGCWYAGAGTRVSRRKFPGSGADECAGVAVASPTSAPRLILPLGFRPAWVDKKVLQAQFGVFK